MITLLTDFGTEDAYVGIMKGVILSVNPRARIIDLTHGIAAQDIAQAAYSLQSAWKYFPAGTVHVVVVDPGVGSDRAILAAESGGHLFLAPDNGILSFLAHAGAAAAVRVENRTWFRPQVSQTFHGRDIFAPVAAHLSAGLDYRRLGTPADWHQLVRLDPEAPVRSNTGELVGRIISVDHFGNLITNIRPQQIQAPGGAAQERAPVFSVGSKTVSGLSESYQSRPENHLLAIVGSSGYIEISVAGGNAKHYLGVATGDAVTVR